MTEPATDNTNEAPLHIAKQGWLLAGGRIDGSDPNPNRPMLGQLYAEYQIPAERLHPYPVVMIHGGMQSGANFTGTPDGRDGWAQHFLRAGYAVYVVDQVGRGRSAYHPSYGPLRQPGVENVRQRFVAPEAFGLFPQARLHSQWPGVAEPGDPVFDQFMAAQQHSIASYPKQQELMREAGAALLDKIGPAILLVHSQAGAFAWPIAQARPELVKAILGVEPNGPPVHDIVNLGAPEWFAEDPVTKVSGLGHIPLDYDPPLAPDEALSFLQSAKPSDPAKVQGWLQQEPARKLRHLDRIPLLILTAEASYHAPYDHATVAYLRQAGVPVDFIELSSLGIHGNGHMMMWEKNNREISRVMLEWLGQLELG
jgi:pimeloyl-ACP methyl ester carboxylesterase